jgi:hypothetical protein
MWLILLDCRHEFTVHESGESEFSCFASRFNSAVDR